MMTVYIDLVNWSADADLCWLNLFVLLLALMHCWNDYVPCAVNRAVYAL